MKQQYLNNSDKILIAIAMIYLTISLACDIIAYKMVNIIGLMASAGALLFPLTYVLADIITELYGSKTAKFIIIAQLLCDLLFIGMILLIIHLPSALSWHLQPSYNKVLDPMLKLYIANIIGFSANISINLTIFSKWKRITKGKYFWLRSTGASFLGLLIYSLITDTIAFYTTTNATGLTEIIIANLVSHIIVIIIYTSAATPLISFIKENINYRYLEQSIKLTNTIYKNTL